MAWVRPATPHEVMCDEFVAGGNYVISYLLRLATAAPLTEGRLGRALTALYRKVPTLRLHFQDRDGKAWLKYMEEENVNFKAIENADVYEEFHEILKSPFHKEGPLWASRLLPWSEKQKEFVNQTSMEGNEDKKDLPHVSHVLLVFHHGITDGHSCLRIVKTLLVLIDQVVEGCPLDEEQVASVIDPKHENGVKEKLIKRFKAVEGILEKRIQDYKDLPVEPMLYRKRPFDISVEPRTVAMPMIIHKDLNKMFLSRCKSMGITYHAGFTALLDAAYVETLKDLGITEPSYPIASMHCVNLRAYYKNCENAFGNGMGALDTKTNAPGNILENFWSYAQSYYKLFKEKYDAYTPLMHEVVEELSDEPTLEPFDWEDAKLNGLKEAFTYSTTNMLDVSKVLSDYGENVRLEYYDRISTVYCYSLMWSSVFQTFNGYLLHSLQYNQNLMDKRTARELSDNIKYVMEKVCD